MDPKSASLDMPLFPPLKKWRITSPYGNRVHPITGKSKFHNGVDLSAQVGTPVYAPTDGKLTYAWHKAGGWQAFIEHPAGLMWTFAHLAAPPDLPNGSFVTAGTEFARTGATGAVTGPHLHFGVKFKAGPSGGWDYQDPVKIFNSMFQPKL